jgi:L-lactate dehydrogenase complex protein LldG
MSARERILRRVIASTRGDADAAAVERTIAQPVAGPAPSLEGDLAARFCERAAALASDVVRASVASEVPAAVASYLDRFGIARRLVCWPQWLSLPWAAQGFAAEARAPRADDLVGVTGAFAAIAETGTLMLLSGSATPAGVSLLPETHVALVRRAQIVATMEEGFARLRAAHAALPRAVNFVSGPSRTADVEQTVTLGAHGPRRVLIVLVED